MLPPDLARLPNFVILDRNAPPGSWAEQRLHALRQVAMFEDQLRRDGLKGQSKQLLAEYEILNAQKSARHFGPASFFQKLKLLKRINVVEISTKQSLQCLQLGKSKRYAWVDYVDLLESLEPLSKLNFPNTAMEAQQYIEGVNEQLVRLPAAFSLGSGSSYKRPHLARKFCEHVSARLGREWCTDWCWVDLAWADEGQHW